MLNDLYEKYKDYPLEETVKELNMYLIDMNIFLVLMFKIIDYKLSKIKV